MLQENLKERIINKIKEINDPAVLQEVSNLFELQEPEEIYQTNNQQKKAIDEAKDQIINKQVLNDKQADNDIEEWLSK